LAAKASLSQGYASAPGAVSVSNSKQPPGKSRKGTDKPEFTPDSVGARQSDRKKRAKTSGKKSKGGEKSKGSKKDSRNLGPDPTSVDIGSSASPEVPAPGGEGPSTFRPRLPRSEPGIGAFAVDGIDGPGEYHEFDDQVSETMADAAEGTSSLPVARMADESNQNKYLDDLGKAEPLSAEDLKGQGVRGWIRQHKLYTGVAVLVVIGTVVAGAVGATIGGSPPPAPTLEPTIAPTAAPTLAGFEEIVDTLTTISPYSVLTDPTTPQNAAATWLMREDEYVVDFNIPNSPKLLQRYALATIYFATEGSSWTKDLKWLTNQDECLWNAVYDNITYGLRECDDQGLATKLQLCKFVCKCSLT